MTGLEARLVVTEGEFSLDVSLEVPAGRTVALVGPNGAGKTTAMMAIAGLRRLEAGHVSLAGLTLDDPGHGVFVPPEQRGVGMVFQDLLLFPHMSVADNVGFGARDEETTTMWLERMGLEGLSARKARDLSGGQSQLAAIARAMATDPKLIILDEPLAALDVGSRASVRRLIVERLAEFAGPRLIITHDPGEAFLMADSLVIVEGGRVTQAGSVAEVRARPKTRYAADMVGTNLYRGHADAGSVIIDTGGELAIADLSLSGPVLVTIHPRSVALHKLRPEGSPRNSWETTVAILEDYGDRVRVGFESPLELTAEVTHAAVAEMGLTVGMRVWVTVKATEVGAELV